MAVSEAGLRWQGRLFVALAIGGTAHLWAQGQATPNPKDLSNAHLIFTVSVVAILLTAPVGDDLISAIGPHLLLKEEERTVGTST